MRAPRDALRDLQVMFLEVEDSTLSPMLFLLLLVVADVTVVGLRVAVVVVVVGSA